MEFSLQKAYDLIAEKFDTWFSLIVKGLPNFVLAIVVFVVFFLAAKYVRKLTNTVSGKVTDSYSVQNILSTAVYTVVVTIGFFLALEILHLDKAVTSLLAGAGVVGLALGFAFQDIASNFVSGIFIAFRHPYEVGDIVEAKGFIGTVTAIDLRTTTITSFQGLETLVPNKYLFTEPVTNYTNIPERRIDLTCGVSYGDDLEKVESLLKKELNDLPHRIESKEVQVHFTEFGDSSINFILMVWVKYRTHKQYLETQSEAVKKIKKVFNENDITIPFPIRTLDFGIKGGEKLSQMDVNIQKRQTH